MSHNNVYHISQVPINTEVVRKLVPGLIREFPQYACFFLTHPDWDCNTIDIKRRPFVHHPSLLAGLKVATRWLTNLTRVNNIRQRENKSPTDFSRQGHGDMFDNTHPWTLNYQKQRQQWLEILSVREYQL